MGSQRVKLSRRSVLAGVAAALATGGCLASGTSPTARTSDWLRPGYEAGRTYYKPSGSPPTGDATVAWTAETDAFHVRERYPDDFGAAQVLVADGTAYTSGGAAVAIDDGTVRRRTDCFRRTLVGFARTDAYETGVLVQSGNVNADSKDFDTPMSIHGIRPSMSTGLNGRCANAVRWTAGSPWDLDHPVDAGCLAGDALFVSLPGTEGSAVRAIDTDDGRSRWTHGLDHEVGTIRADDELVYVATGDGDPGRVSVLDRDSGERHGHLRTTRADDLVAARDGDAYLRPITDRDDHPRLVAIDTREGRERWTLDPTAELSSVLPRPVERIVSLAIAPEAAFVSIGLEQGPEAIVALERTDGSVRWLREQTIYGAAVTATDGTLYASGTDGRVLALDSVTGERRWSIDVEPALPDGASDELGRVVVGDTRLFVPARRTLLALEDP